MTFRDEVTTVRVLDSGDGSFDLSRLNKEMERDHKQESVLTVARGVSMVP